MSRAAEGVRVPEVTSSTLATIGSELPQPREVGKRGIKVSSPNAGYGRQLQCKRPLGRVHGPLMVGPRLKSGASLNWTQNKSHLYTVIDDNNGETAGSGLIHSKKKPV